MNFTINVQRWRDFAIIFSWHLRAGVDWFYSLIFARSLERNVKISELYQKKGEEGG
jgi:hypothetical protein